MTIRRIAFVGKAGSGKTTLAQFLVESATFGDGLPFVRLSFADAVKHFTEAMFMRPITNKPEYRSFLQMLATQCRKVWRDTWIAHLALKIRSYPPAVPVVIDDVRFLNEAEYLASHGFVLIRLTGRASKLTKRQMQHQSEQELERIPVDYTLDNSGALDATIMQLLPIIGVKVEKPKRGKKIGIA